MSGVVTKYSSEVTSWSTSGYNTISLNSSARSDMSSLDTFKICLIESSYDLPDSEPSLGVDDMTGMRYEDYSGTSSDPYIDYTAAVVVTDNAVFFGSNF